MPWQKKRQGAERVVRHKLKDGSVKEYRYKTYDKKPAPKRNDDTLGGLIEAYQASPEWRALAGSSQVFYSTYLRSLRPMAHLELPVVTRRTIIAARNIIAEGRGNGAAQNFVQAVGALFAWAVDQDWLESSPVTKIKRLAHGHIPAWTPEEAARAMALPEPYRRVVVLALYTGQRRGDLCTMGWSAYDGTSIRLVQQKTRKPMVIPVHPDLKLELDRWERIATTILTNPLGMAWKQTVLSSKLPGQLKKIGLREGLNVHGLRKLAAANLAEAGCSTLEIAAITGHASLGMLQLYTASADQERMATAAIVRLTGRKK